MGDLLDLTFDRFEARPTSGFIPRCTPKRLENEGDFRLIWEVFRPRGRVMELSSHVTESFPAGKMDSTPISLLERLRHPVPGEAWDRFVLLYTPLIYLWANRLGLAGADADDLVQDVFVVLVRTLPAFGYDAAGRFRGWLWTITLNKFRERDRRACIPVVAAVDLESVAESGGSDPTEQIDEQEYREYVTRRALEILQCEFEPATWRAFWATVVDERTPAEAAGEYGMTLNAVYLAKGRVLRRLRGELAGLLD